MCKWTALLLIVSTGILGVIGAEEKFHGHFLNKFAVRLMSGGREEADRVALEHGFRVIREIKNMGVFLLEHPEVHHRSKRSAVNELQRLEQDPAISHAQQEVVLNRVKRTILHDKQIELPIRSIQDDSVYHRVSVPVARDNVYTDGQQITDPKFKDCWFLVNNGQSGGEKGLDLNVEVAWDSGFNGQGVVVTVLDDGVDHRHPDLIDNYDPEASTDLNDKQDTKEDPMPNTNTTENSHGTRCAGEIAAAANNDVCGVGVAYKARIGGVRVLDGDITDSLEAEALTFNNQYVHVYSASWGPDDDGGTMEGPRQFALDALHEGVTNGRGGLGSIYVWATGNGGMNRDDCSADGYVSRPETLSVGSVTDWGRSPFFMENCSSTLAVVPSGGEDYQGQEDKEGVVKLKVVTTDINGGCIENFQGTSSAAPLASGCVANVLQANPRLTWRDVQHIVVRGTRVPSADSSWTINGAGHHVSHRFGFGLMDCGKMVELAQSWDLFPQRLHCNVTRNNYQLLPIKGELSDSLMFHGCDDSLGPDIDRLEHVQVHVKMSTEHRGDVALRLISPSGTKSMLLSPRPKDRHVGNWEFTFMTVHSWDENPKGKWTLQISHMSSGDELLHVGNSVKSSSAKLLQAILDQKSRPVGYIESWSLSLFGTHGTRHDRTSMHAVKEQRAYTPTEDEVLQVKKKEIEISKRVQVKRNRYSKKTAGTKSALSRSMDSPGLESRLISELWSALHSHGAMNVKKRVLGSNTGGRSLTSVNQNEQHRENLDGMSEHELLGEIIRLLKRINEDMKR